MTVLIPTYRLSDNKWDEIKAMDQQRPLYEKIKLSIKNDIAKGKYSIGDRIPSERAIAEQFLVSRITAQRALNDLQQEGLLEKQTGRKGLFVPNPIQAPQKQTSLIAVVIDDIRDTFGAEIFRGIEDYLWSQKIHTVICDVDRNFKKVEQYFYSLLNQNISGVIFAPVIDIGYEEKNKHLISILEKAKIPFTLIDRYIPGILSNYVGTNHYESAKLMTKHLLSQGYRRIILANGLDCSSMNDRKRGFIDAYHESNIPLNPLFIIQINENLLQGAERTSTLSQLRQMILSVGSFDCYYALNDRLLDAGMQVVSELPVHEKVFFVAHNRITHPVFSNFPNLPHFEEPTYAMGREAARLLLDIIRHPCPMVVQKTLECSFVTEQID